MSPPEVAYDAIMQSDADLLGWLDQIRRFGVSFVRGAPTVSGHGRRHRRTGRVPAQQQLRAAVGRGVQARPRQPGVHRPRAGPARRPRQPRDRCRASSSSTASSSRRPAATQSSSTGSPVPPSWRAPTRRRTSCSSTTPLPWRYRDGAGTDLSYRGPMIRLDPTARCARCATATPCWLRSTSLPTGCSTRTAPCVPSGLVRSGRFEIRARLQPGDVMCFDNYRILHGRTEFDPNSGPATCRAATSIATTSSAGSARWRRRGSVDPIAAALHSHSRRLDLVRRGGCWWSSPASIRGPSAFQIQPAVPPHVSLCRPVSPSPRLSWSARTGRHA